MGRTRERADSLRLGKVAESQTLGIPEPSRDQRNAPPMCVKTALWSTTAEKAGMWYPRILEAVERFMVRWQEDEAILSRQRREFVVGGAQGNGERGQQEEEERKRGGQE